MPTCEEHDCLANPLVSVDGGADQKPPIFASASEKIGGETSPLPLTQAEYDELCAGFELCTLFDQNFIRKLNTYIYWSSKRDEYFCANCCEPPEPPLPPAAIRMRETFGGGTFTGVIDEPILTWTYVKAFANSQCLIFINLDSMIEAEVGPPENDVAMSAVYSVNTGNGFFDFGTNFINSTITGGDTSDSVSEVTHIGTTRRVIAPGDIPITINADMNLAQGSNMRGWHRHIRVAVIEVDNQWIA